MSANLSTNLCHGLACVRGWRDGSALGGRWETGREGEAGILQGKGLRWKGEVLWWCGRSWEEGDGNVEKEKLSKDCKIIFHVFFVGAFHM